VLRTREGEASVQCELLVDVGDNDAARAFLDAAYDTDHSPDGDAWVELFPIDDEKILRARLTLDGGRLPVGTTSEERADRVLLAVLAAFPDATVLEDRHTPIDVTAMTRRHALDAESSTVTEPEIAPAFDTPEALAFLDELRDRFERRWCDESVPALSGLTPRQAAHDPTRREELVRLIASFEDHAVPDGAIMMRPGRLRELLEL
jgi:hypothetical protein